MARQLSIVLGLLLFLITPPLARADIYNLDFSFSSFTLGAPQDPVSGSLLFDKSPSNFSILSVLSIDLTIAGHTYSVPPVDGLVGVVGSDCTTGGGGITCIVTPNTDSFLMSWNTLTGAPDSFGYAVSSQSGIWNSYTADRFEFTPSAVPLPGALPLFATGLGALGLLGWRRKRKQVAA